MKKAIKKLMAALLAVAMLCAMAVPAFAADNATKTTIKINGTGKSYEAYRILNVTNDGSDKYAYTFNTKYEDIVKAATGKDTLSDVLNVISGYTANGTEIDAFAKRVWNAIKSNSSISADVTTDNKEFTNVDQGYYLIVEKAIADHDDSEVDDTYSLLMLSTAGKNTITVEAKENSPELTKKVKEKNDSTNYTSDWQDAADYDIGDDVHFMLTGTVSEKYDSYETYKYVFHDKMSSGLQLNADSFVVKVDDVVVSGYKVNTTALKDGCTFEVAFDDLKKVLEKAVTPNSKITVEYTAKLTGDGVKYGSEGNPNEARLEFANNPYGDGTGYTPWDKVTVFTYKLVANKVDNNNQPLEGAGFTLYKKDNNDSWNAVDTEVKGEHITTFNFNGLDAGIYKLVETTVPEGYNKAEDLVFKIVAEYNTDAVDPKLISLKVVAEDGTELKNGEDEMFTTTINDGALTTSIVNKSGTTLPGTGGIGTTIFYVVGGGLMVAAVILLITKKRMEKDN